MIKKNRVKYKDLKRRKREEESSDILLTDLVDDATTDIISTDTARDMLDIVYDKGTEAVNVVSDILSSTEDLAEVAGEIIGTSAKVVGNTLVSIVETLGDLSD